MTDQVVTAIIAAVAVLLGGGMTGLITLINQRMALNAADRKTRLEIEDRDRTRFHEARKEAYAEFLAAVNDATGRITFETVEKLKRAGKSDQFAIVTKPGFENFGPDAPMRMTRQQSIVQILSGSPEVRQASLDLINAVMAFAGIDPDKEDWNEVFMAALHVRTEAYERFVDAANRELVGEVGASLTKGDEPQTPTDR